MLTRRRFVSNSAALSTALALAPRFAFAKAGPATFRNPILGGDHPDASPIRVGNDFYLTHSSFDYAPGLIVYHSTDLINWINLITFTATNTTSSFFYSPLPTNFIFFRIEQVP